MVSWLPPVRARAATRVPRARVIRARGFALASALYAVVFADLAPARAEDEGRTASIARLEASAPPLDIILLFESSSGAATRDDEVRALAVALARAAKPRDTLTVVGFSDRAVETLPTLALTSDQAANVRSRLGHRSTARSQSVDLGAGLEAALRILERPEHAPTALVVVVSDLCARPSDGSPYAGPAAESAPCREVRRPGTVTARARAVAADEHRAVRVLVVAPGSPSELGLHATREMLGEPQRIERKPNLPLLDTILTALPTARATLAIERLLRAPPISVVTSSLALGLDGEQAITLTLASESPVDMRVHVTGIRARDDSIAFVSEEPRSIELLASRRTTLRIRARNVPEKAKPWSTVDPGRDVPLEVELELELTPPASIADLLDRPLKRSMRIEKTITLSLAPARGPHLIATAPRRVEIPPHAAADVPIELDSPIGWATLELACTFGSGPMMKLRIPPRGEVSVSSRVFNDAATAPWMLAEVLTREIEIRGECQLTAETPSGERIDLGLERPVAATTMVWTVGTSLVRFLGGLLMGLVCILVWIREVSPRLAPAGLMGRLVVDQGTRDSPRLVVPLRGRARLTMEGTDPTAEPAAARLEGDRLLLPGLKGEHAELYAEKTGKRSVMRFRKVAGERTRVGKAALGSSPILIRRRRARLSMGPYRIRIE